ncbi:MAG: glycosyltransferase family 39 protein [Haloarculaceae archaeon]
MPRSPLVTLRTWPWLTPRRLAFGLAALAAALVFSVSHEVFPYHSLNHDEGVYLQQAAMLLEGKLSVSPPVPEAFRPWFFVADGPRLYPKYAPVPAAMFAAGELLGGYRLALAGIAAGCVGLLYATAAEAFDRRTGSLAAALLVASPLFLVQSSVFLPYIPALLLNLLFAWSYLRADRTGDRRFAALAGLAIGLAFFARPYTAVLFAAPFVAHALWTLRSLDREPLVRQAATAVLGLAGVAVTLGYNASMTGSPTTFPYQAFAPLDGPGFGYRRILGYDRVYSVPLALEVHARALVRYVTNWTPAGLLGTLAAAVGLGTVLRRLPAVDPRKLPLAGLAVSVPLGQLYFWGTLNTLGDLDRIGDGLLYFLGPYYHVGLLVPTAVFGAVGLLWLWDRLRARAGTLPDRTRLDRRQVRVLGAVGLLVIAVPVGALAIGAVASPLAANAEVTDRYERAYDPFEGRSLDGALVFLPDPYGDWLNHPFQALRNDPGLDEGTVYALEERPFAVLDAVPNRPAYRYVFRGEWVPIEGEGVTGHLQRVRAVEGPSVHADIRAGMPTYTRGATVQLSGTETASAALETDPGEPVDLNLTVSGATATVRSPALSEPVSVPLERQGSAELRIFVDSGTVDSFSYRVELPIDRGNGSVRALTPALEVCRQPRRCGGEAAYVPGVHRPNVTLEARIHA